MYKLIIKFSDGTTEEVDELFATKEDAEAEYEEWLEGYSAGGDVLKLAGEDYSDAEIVGRVIKKA